MCGNMKSKPRFYAWCRFMPRIFKLCGNISIQDGDIMLSVKISFPFGSENGL